MFHETSLLLTGSASQLCVALGKEEKGVLSTMAGALQGAQSRSLSSHTLPAALCPCCFECPQPHTVTAACSLCPFTPAQGQSRLAQNSLSKSTTATNLLKGHREGHGDAFKLFFQGLKEALLPNKQAHNHKGCSCGTAGCRLFALCSWTVRQKGERTKGPLTIPLFISTLVGWRLRLIHSG